MSELSVPQRRSPFRFLVSLLPGLAGGAIGASLALLSVRWFPEVHATQLQKLILLAGIVPLLVLVLALHEVGHLFAGWLARFRALLLIVGPLKVERTGEGGVRVGFNRSLTLAGGLAVSVPMDTHDLRRRMLLMVAGGPGASLLGGVLALALGRWLSRPGAEVASFGETAVAGGLLTFGIASLGIGLATLFPGTASGYLTDGARILRLLRNNRDTDREVAILALTGLSMAGARPREWPQTLIDQMLAGGDPGSTLEPLSRILAFSWAIDRDRIDEARTHLNAALAGRDLLPEASRVPLDLQAAWFIAVHDGDARRAREIFQKVGDRGLLTPAHERHLTEGAILWREGDTAGAREKLEEARRLLPQCHDPGGARADADQIEALLRAL